MYIYIYIHNILKKYLDLSNLGIFIFLWLSPSRPCSCWSLALPCCFECFGFGTGNSRRPEKSEPTPPDVVKCDRRVGLGFPGLEHLKFKCAYLFKGPASTAEIYLRSMSHYAESESLEDAWSRLFHSVCPAIPSPSRTMLSLFWPQTWRSMGCSHSDPSLYIPSGSLT